MTEQEAEIKRVISYIRSCREAGIAPTITMDKSGDHFILNALEEIQQYRALGTVEELREAREKQIPKKPKNRIKDPHKWDIAKCPKCGCNIIQRHDYCPVCGQHIDWREEE